MTAGGNSGLLGWTRYQLFQHSAGKWNLFQMPSSLSFPYISAISADDNGIIFAALDNRSNESEGVYYTKDTGRTWTFAGLKGIEVMSLKSYGDTTYALTDGQWIYSFLARPFINSIPSYNINRQTLAYPNPAFQYVTLKYTLPKESRVTGDVYDILGKKVMNIPAQMQSAGTQNIYMNIENLHHGIYIYQIQAGNTLIQGKFLKE
jgi:hypothetical protein